MATGVQDNFTALHFAARKGKLDIVLLLLAEKPAVDINAVTKASALALSAELALLTHAL